MSASVEIQEPEDCSLPKLICLDEIKNFNLSEFQTEKVLFNNANRKTIGFLGNLTGRDDQAIVILEKISFENQLSDNIGEFFNSSDLNTDFVNDIYRNFILHTKSEINSIKVSTIYPATQKHIQKYSHNIGHLVNETPDIYENIVLPHLTKDQFNLQWVYNILEHKSEQERILAEDTDDNTGFVIVPDLKWDGKTLETLYFLAICRRRDIKSLRDLKEEHLPLLENIHKKGIEAIKKKYSLDSSQLRIYVHYQPSFYHFHVHFTYLQYDAPGIFTEKSHLLSTVINNIKLLPDYYQKVNLPFVVFENQNLYKELKEKQALP